MQVSPLRKPYAPYQSKFLDPVQVACGAAHTVIVARDGYKVWSWGRGRCGFLESVTNWIVIPPLRCGGLQQQKIQRKRNERALRPSKSRMQPTTAPMETFPPLSRYAFLTQPPCELALLDLLVS
ncbi:hypothetical protein HN51_027127 [Arachis hypogaea]